MTTRTVAKLKEGWFHPETLKYLESADLKHRKALGQYFTPRPLIEKLFERLPALSEPKILDPGCGTGEFLLAAADWFVKPEIHGWEIDANLIPIASKIVPKAQIERADALSRDDYGKYDLVVGNPPYFEFDPTPAIRTKFGHLLNGRVNIYTLFIYQSIKFLKDGGHLAFVVSPSMNNGAFFAKLRAFIVDTCNIEYLSVLNSPDLFLGALQSVMLLMLKKGVNKGNYVFRKGHQLIFSERAQYLKEVFKGRVTLSDIGYTVKTGKIVWNDNKELLTDQAEGNITLLWASNITPKGLKFGHIDKPQYVRLKRGYDVGPAIVVNRIVGRPGIGAIRAALVPDGMRFVAENHVNVIYPPKQNSFLQVNRVPLESILAQFNSREKSEIVQSVTGNTQISKTELEHLFPIDPT